MRDVTIIRGREETAEIHEIKATIPVGGETKAGQMMQQQSSPIPPPPASYNKELVYLSDVLDGLTGGILTDEGIAADHSIAATSGC